MSKKIITLKKITFRCKKKHFLIKCTHDAFASPRLFLGFLEQSFYIGFSTYHLTAKMESNLRRIQS